MMLQLLVEKFMGGGSCNGFRTLFINGRFWRSLIVCQDGRCTHGAIVNLTAISHTSQEPWPWNYESPKEKCPKAIVPTHLQNHVLWSRILKCSVKSYVTKPSTKCCFHEPRVVTMRLWEPKRKHSKAIPTHFQNHILWSRTLECSVKAKCYFQWLSIHAGSLHMIK
jgi:hypothetical protein